MTNTKTKSKTRSKTKKATAQAEASDETPEALDGVPDEDAIDDEPDDLDATESDKGGEEEDDDEAAAPDAKKRSGDEEDDDEPDPDDVEADLDTILKDRIASADDEDEDEDGAEFGSTAGSRIPPKTEVEFVCKSCFLVKSVTQRVEGSDDLCMDCV